MMRERRGATAVIAAVLLWAGACGADVIFDSYPKQPGGGYAFCGPQNFLNYHDYDMAQRFVVPADGDYVLNRVTLALDHVVGNHHGANVCLMSESAIDTVPDVVLSCAPPFIVPGTDPVDIEASFPDAPVLQANAAYWICCSTDADAYIGWTNSSYRDGYWASRRDGGPWTRAHAPQIAAWRVEAVRSVSATELPITTGGTSLRVSPNPFNPRTTIKYDLPEAGTVRLSVFDVAGRLVRTLVDDSMPQGSHEAVWDGRDATGREVGSGSYLARLEFGGKAETVRMGLIR